jgi:hypothetical protein
VVPEVLFGHAPGQEVDGEAAAAQKVARLKMYLNQQGPLDRLAANTVIDLRASAAMSVIDRHSPFLPASTE